MSEGRVLGVDPGRVRIGLALSDEAGGRMALPFATVARGGSDAAGVEAVVRALEPIEGEVRALVVGLPLRLDGSEGEAARRARRFGDALGARMEIPPVYWDERLTSAAAERDLQAFGLDGRARRKVVDQAAAAILLQSFLDARAHREAGSEEE